MRQGSNGRRPRGRPHRKQHGGAPRHSNFDSSGPEGRIRGNAHQVYDKYIALARDALSSGDRISAETYYQHAEHYYRVLNSRTDPRPEGESPPARQRGNGQADAATGANGQEQPVPGEGDQPYPAAGNGEQKPTGDGERPQTQAQRRRKPAPVAEPDTPEQPPEDSEPAEA